MATGCMLASCDALAQPVHAPHLISSLTVTCGVKEAESGFFLQRSRSEPKHLVTSWALTGADDGTLQRSPRGCMRYHNAESTFQVAPQSARRHYEMESSKSDQKVAVRNERRHFHTAMASSVAIDHLDDFANRGHQHLDSAAHATKPWDQACWDDAVGTSSSATRRHFFEQSYWAERYAELIGRPGLKAVKRVPALKAEPKARKQVKKDFGSIQLDLQDVARRLSLSGVCEETDVARHAVCRSSGKRRVGVKRGADSAVASTTASTSASAVASALPSAAASGVATPERSEFSDEGLTEIAEEETPQHSKELYAFNCTPLKLLTDTVEEQDLSSLDSLPEKREAQALEPAPLPLGMRRVVHSLLSGGEARRFLERNGGADAAAVYGMLRELALSQA